MAKEIIVNNTIIQAEHYREELENGLHKICIEFNVTSETYHEIATLLYKETFDVKVPENFLTFKGTIQEYSTSITNLYEKGQVAQYRLTLREMKK